MDATSRINNFAYLLVENVLAGSIKIAWRKWFLTLMPSKEKEGGGGRRPENTKNFTAKHDLLGIHEYIPTIPAHHSLARNFLPLSRRSIIKVPFRM